MSTSSPPAPVSSRWTFVFPAAMAKAIRMIIPYHEGIISDSEGWGEEPPAIIKIKTHPKALLQGETLLMERKGGLFFEGIVESVDEVPTSAYETTASIRVKEDTVLSCREHRSDRAPVPPMGAAVHFSRPDPYTMEATVRKVERLESADHTIVHLQALSPPPPLLSISDTVILETLDQLHHWKGYIRHYVDSMFFRDFGEECSPNMDGTVSVSIYVPDQVPLLMGIAFQPATKSPCGSEITRRKADVKQADKKSTQSEGVPLLMSITVQPAPKSPCGSEIARKKADVKQADKKSSQSEGDALRLNEASASTSKKF